MGKGFDIEERKNVRAHAKSGSLKQGDILVGDLLGAFDQIDAMEKEIADAWAELKDWNRDEKASEIAVCIVVLKTFYAKALEERDEARAKLKTAEERKKKWREALAKSLTRSDDDEDDDDGVSPSLMCDGCLRAAGECHGFPSTDEIIHVDGCPLYEEA